MPHRYRDLVVWQKAMDLATEVHRFSRAFPKDEMYSLTSQIGRAANWPALFMKSLNNAQKAADYARNA